MTGNGLRWEKRNTLLGNHSHNLLAAVYGPCPPRGTRMWFQLGISVQGGRRAGKLEPDGGTLARFSAAARPCRSEQGGIAHLSFMLFLPQVCAAFARLLTEHSAGRDTLSPCPCSLLKNDMQAVMLSSSGEDLTNQIVSSLIGG